MSAIYPADMVEVVERLAVLLGGPDRLDEAERWVDGLAFHPCANALLELEGTCLDYAFQYGARALIAATFARHCDGLVPEGPPWRIAPDETDRPTRPAYYALSSFEEVAP